MSDLPPRWARAVVDAVGAMRDDVAAIRAAMLTRDDAARFATRDDLARLATRDDLARLATREDLDALRAYVDTLRAEMDALRAELIRTRTEIMERIDRLQAAVTQQQQEESVNYNMSATTAGRLVSLEESLIAVTRLLRMLQSRVEELENRSRGH
jgi:chromosome segregation ATPase